MPMLMGLWEHTRVRHPFNGQHWETGSLFAPHSIYEPALREIASQCHRSRRYWAAGRRGGQALPFAEDSKQKMPRAVGTVLCTLVPLRAECNFSPHRLCLRGTDTVVPMIHICTILAEDRVNHMLGGLGSRKAVDMCRCQLFGFWIRFTTNLLTAKRSPYHTLPRTC